MKMPITAWQVIRPYWVSHEKWLARGLLLLVILFDMATIYAAVKISYWQKDFFDALAAYDLSAIKPLMITLLILMAISVSTGVFSTYFKQLLEIRWRTWVTEVFIQKWLKDNKFYHIEQKSATDNPDQRIAEDLALMADKTLSLFTGFIRNFVNMISYGVIIWGISGSMVVHVFGGDYIVPGLLLWIGIAYAVLGSLIMEKIGRPMVKLDYKQQRFEADFRYLLMRIRENSEQIALYKGQKIEKQRLRHSFSAVRQNWRGIMTYTKRIAFVEALYIDIGGYLPYFLIVPQYFAKKISIGEVMQTSIAFSRLRQALSWFIFNYKELAEVRAVLQRLCEFEGAIQQPVQKDIQIEYHHNQGLRTQALSLFRPTGELLSAIPNTQIQQGARWLIQGRSGIGKSTFLRALAGLWVYGNGQIFLPQGSTLFFLPQKSYLPYGSLKAALCYPKSEHDFTDEACAQILEDVHLPEQILNLHNIEYWEKRLSPGEQQRLAFARILLHKPDYLFLDEATSALDINNEKNLYQLLVDVLPNTTVISIAHHQSLEDFHTHILKFDQIKPVNS